MLLVGIALLVSGVRRRSALHCLAGLWCIVAMLWIDLRDLPFAAHHGVIPIHLLLAGMLVIGAVFRDVIGRMIQRLGAAVLLLLAVIAATCPPDLLGNPPHLLLTLYPLVVAVFAVAYGFANKNCWYYAAAAGSLCGWASGYGWNVFCQARRALAGLDYIAWGAASFFVALLLSLMKMGAFKRFHARRENKE